MDTVMAPEPLCWQAETPFVKQGQIWVVRTYQLNLFVGLAGLCPSDGDVEWSCGSASFTQAFSQLQAMWFRSQDGQKHRASLSYNTVISHCSRQVFLTLYHQKTNNNTGAMKPPPDFPGDEVTTTLYRSWHPFLMAAEQKGTYPGGQRGGDRMSTRAPRAMLCVNWLLSFNHSAQGPLHPGHTVRNIELLISCFLWPV
ncbi:uncharacterized protein LOC116794364 isoform X2 [Chiroxiphia lanceolata]|uniref:uncharacterized protein LOC116794364 isoform X2 n=1 Tax=Chiroxiphia lanceolata TaxID=296741 RepID=UPI0013CEDCF7|nr:uncharacterized protein LOC116794364 isoform X2 [Chiroxiphia lanceolata]